MQHTGRSTHRGRSPRNQRTRTSGPSRLPPSVRCSERFRRRGCDTEHFPPHAAGRACECFAEPRREIATCSRNSLAGGFPHTGDIDVLLAIVIEVRPGGAHAGTHILDVRLFGDDREGAVSVIAVQLGDTEIIGDTEIGQALGIVACIAPGTREAIAIVVCVQSRALGGFNKGPIALRCGRDSSEDRCEHRSRESGSDTGRDPGSTCRCRNRRRDVRRHRNRQVLRG